MTAAKNAKALAELARDLNARVAAIADPESYAELKEALSGSGIEATAGEDAVVEAAAASGRLGDGGDQRCCRTAADAGGGRARRNGGARQQGMSRLRRHAVHAARQREPVRRCCRLTPSTTRCFRRSAPTARATSTASS